LVGADASILVVVGWRSAGGPTLSLRFSLRPVRDGADEEQRTNASPQGRAWRGRLRRVLQPRRRGGVLQRAR